jgi:hypothetical protein
VSEKWRIEYMIGPQDIDSDSELGTARKQWRIYADVITEFYEPYAFSEVESRLPAGHPLLKYIRYIFSDTCGRVFLKPYEPFELHPSVVECMGPEWLDRIHVRDEVCKVWASSDGWTWLHHPGDSVR